MTPRDRARIVTGPFRDRVAFSSAAEGLVTAVADAIAEAERAARAAAFEKAELIALRYRDEAVARKHSDMPAHSLGQAFAADVIAKLICARAASPAAPAAPAAPQEPDRATIARVVAVLLDEQRNLLTPKDVLEQLAAHPSDVGPYQLARDRNAVIENRIAWLSEILAHYGGGGT